MNLDMWFKDDIKNILIGIELASLQPVSGLSAAEQATYRQGFNAALTAMAASFGLLKFEASMRTSLFHSDVQALPDRNEW